MGRKSCQNEINIEGKEKKTVHRAPDFDFIGPGAGGGLVALTIGTAGESGFSSESERGFSSAGKDGKRFDGVGRMSEETKERNFVPVFIIIFDKCEIENTSLWKRFWKGSFRATAKHHRAMAPTPSTTGLRTGFKSKLNLSTPSVHCFNCSLSVIKVSSLHVRVSWLLILSGKLFKIENSVPNSDSLKSL